MTHSRRHVLAVGAFVALLVLAGCSGSFLGSGGAAAVDHVPGNVDSVVRVDMAVTNDQATTELLNTLGSSAYGAGSTSTSEAEAEFERETGLDPEQAQEFVYFQRQRTDFSTPRYAGTIVHANWDTDEVTRALREESGYKYEETEYNGRPLFVPDAEYARSSSTFAVLGNGQFAFGSEQAVRDAIDVATGTTDGFGGELRSAYDSTRGGHVTFAARVPDEQLPRSTTTEVDIGQYQDVRVVSGVYYTNGDTVGTDFGLSGRGP
jgi:hypothetical protein